jgi:DNA polymerase III subunit delta'
MGFSTVLGQDHLKKELLRQISGDTLNHAYLIYGHPGLDPQGFAKTFAQGILCRETRGEVPCGSCNDCNKVLSRNHEDLGIYDQEVLKVEDVRSLEKDIHIKPYRSGKKIYIINHGEGMTPQGQNALLKTLEEPPGFGIILIVARSKEALLPTIQSRCQGLGLKPVSEEGIYSALISTYGYEDGKAREAAKISGGRIKTALRFLQDEDYENRRKQLFSLYKDMKEKGITASLESLDGLSIEKDQVEEVLELSYSFFRDVLLYKALQRPQGLIHRDQEAVIKTLGSSCSNEGVLKSLKEIEKMQSHTRANVSTKSILEMLVLNIHQALSDK